MNTRIVVSSKELKEVLSNIDFSEDHVVMLSFYENIMRIITTKTTVELSLHTKFCFGNIQQENTRWDWLYNLVSQINEQPIDITLGNNNLHISFDY